MNARVELENSANPAKCLFGKCCIKLVVLKHFNELPLRGIFHCMCCEVQTLHHFHTVGVKVPHNRHVCV